MNRGDVWLIDLGSKIGQRPVVVLTRQKVLEYLNKVTVAEIMTQGKGYPTEVFINQGLSQELINTILFKVVLKKPIIHPRYF